MLGRRRQSIHGGFGQLGEKGKTPGPFGRGLGSSHSRTISPRASFNNLQDSNNRLSSLAETPTSPKQGGAGEDAPGHDGTNGTGRQTSAEGGPPLRTVVNGSVTAEDIFDAPPPPTDSTSAQKTEPLKDADGFTVPPPKSDPISEAQREAAATSEETDQLFKLNIQKEPVAEEDADAKRAALSNVANTLSSMAMPSRKNGTVRGRRDVRNTIYIPSAPVLESTAENTAPAPSPPSMTASRPSAVAALASGAGVGATSDSQSIRSATSLGGFAQFKHPDMTEPGLNTSIIETVSAVFEGGEAKEVKITGEIAFSYVTDDDSAKGKQLKNGISMPLELTVL
jgi:F-BAR domain only protein